MTNEPLVSVVIPTYERVELTLAAVDSVLNQEYKNFEIIVVDDGSSEVVISQLEKSLPVGVVLIKQSHSGLPAVARNEGIHRATGEWIAFLDSDDTWMKNKLKIQIKTALLNNWDCVSADFHIDSTRQSSIAVDYVVSELHLSSMLRQNLVINSSVLVRKACLVEVGGIASVHNVRGVEDYATWLRLLTRFKWGHINTTLGTYVTVNSEAERISTHLNPYNHIYAIVDFMGWLRLQGEKLFLARIIMKAVPLTLKRIR
jgi:teichuronic acid biosynthesis glycosyltransferase TuaG